jgi:riboflavin kinase / FMN adenylyltransferase
MENRKFTGIVEKGKGEGKTIGFPTANIELTDKTVSGIYAAKAKIGGKEYVAAVYADQARGLLEAYLLDFEGDLYGKEIEVELFDKIREAAAFEGVEALKEQIAKDVETIRALMHTRTA